MSPASLTGFLGFHTLPPSWEATGQLGIILQATDGDETEGQEADHMAAELSGDFGDWAVDVYSGVCEKCKKPYIWKVS